jgi:two-component system NtrC family response regulator
MTKYRCLLVDDDKQILRTFTKVLTKAGYVVDTVETAVEAEKKLRRNHYDIALIDIKLPDAEGIDLLLRIPTTSDTAKVIITGYSTAEYGKKAADYGADDFLVKPVKAQELLEVFNRLVSRK